MDKYSATWVSHSSMSDFVNCPKAYFLNHVYKDPTTGRKITVMKPALALGQAVHDVLESLSVLPVDERFEKPLSERFETSWEKVAGKRGGFLDDATEERFKKRGREMLSRVLDNPGPLKEKAVKIRMDLPHYWLSEDDNIILCGKIDWLEYLEKDEAVKILDFKTGKGVEAKDSLQLPIYLLLVSELQRWPVVGASYWYLDRDDEPQAQELPEVDAAYERVLKLAKRVKLARQLEKYDCPEGDACRYCKELQRVVAGEAERVGVDEIGRDIYILPKKGRVEPEVEIL